jgi:hypothetical protein
MVNESRKFRKREIKWRDGKWYFKGSDRPPCGVALWHPVCIPKMIMIISELLVDAEDSASACIVNRLA